MSSKLNLVYILGAGHCGSTLLNLLLNGHSQIIGLSEIKYISKFIGINKSVDNPLNSEFWCKVKEYYETNFSKDFESLDLSLPSQKEHQEWINTNSELFLSILNSSSATIFVDASKDWKRLDLLQNSGLFNIKVIHLVRDGRAILNSYNRKYNSFKKGFRIWFLSQLRALFIQNNFSKHNLATNSLRRVSH